MGKKVDLNRKRNTNGTQKNHSFSHQSHGRQSNSEKPVNTSKYSTNNFENISESSYDFDDSAKITIKWPKIGKTIIKSLAFIPIIVLMFFVVLFNENEASATGTGLAMAKTCRTVTVTDTENHTYDGQVNIEDYIAGVVAAEVALADNIEYYKVAAISARTYFLNHTSSNCTVEGNATFQAYMDVEDSPYKDKIKQAVEETNGLVISKNGDVVGGHYASACVVNADDEYYYVRYGSISLGEPNIQKIPKEWDSTSAFSGYLGDWYSMVDKSDTDYDNKSCPNNHDYGMSQLGALYLITGENYSYEEVIEYYYGNDIEIVNANTYANSKVVDGFMNPVNNFSCSNGYGCRYHPIHQYYRIHSGVDLGASSGEPVYATKSGKVIQVLKTVPGYSETYGYGNYITIDHEDGTKTRYAHLLYGSIPDYIYVGATVSQGEQIAQVGSTGTSTGPHLHYEIHINGSTTNPYNYLDLSNISNAAQCNSNANVPMSKCE